MPSGTVKWFNNAKGYGFILPDEGGEDLFVHYTSILMEGYKTLKAGQVVQFEMVEGGKGFHATNIKVPDSASTEASAMPAADTSLAKKANVGSSVKHASGSELEAMS